MNHHMRRRMVGSSALWVGMLGLLSCGQTESVITDLSGSVDSLLFGTHSVATIADTTIGPADTTVVTRFDTIFAPRDTVFVDRADTTLVVDTVFVPRTDT